MKRRPFTSIRRRLILSFILAMGMLSVQECIAQYGNENTGVEYEENAVVQSLKRSYLSYYRNAERIDGWRVLLSSTTDRRELDLQVRKFKRDYPDVKYDWEYDSPYYKLKVGAYTSRLEAKQALGKYKETFPGAIEIQERIEKEKFLK